MLAGEGDVLPRPCLLLACPARRCLLCLLLPCPARPFLSCLLSRAPAGPSQPCWPGGTAAAGAGDTHHILRAGPLGCDLDPLDAQALGTVVFRLEDIGAAQLHRVALCQMQHLPALAVDPDGQEESWGENSTHRTGRGARGQREPAPRAPQSRARQHQQRGAGHGSVCRGTGVLVGCSTRQVL